MVDEVIELFSSIPSGTVIDATLGGAGHAKALLEARPDLSLLGIDQDQQAIAAAAERLAPYGDRAQIVSSRFDRIANVCAGIGVTNIAGALFDLGVSSPQLDWADRGFSFRNDGPLDMRMDPSVGLSAADVVNEYQLGDLIRLIRRYGDERFAVRIAHAIVDHRPIMTTTRLADVVVAAIPAAARRRGGHPAKRTFQAIRIEVNQELLILEPSIASVMDLLMVGGRVLVLSYHSGEDRIVKDLFRRRSTVDVPPGLPVPATDEPEFAVLRPLARRPSDEEIAANRRAASARLRGVERIKPAKSW